MADRIETKGDKEKTLRCGEASRCPLSAYAEKLERHVKDRYIIKISCLGIDPLLISEKKFSSECLPPVEASDLVSYLVLETSHYSNKQFKAYKSLQSYNQMVSGFITSVLGQMVAGKYLVIAKVRHSQRMNDPPIPLWIITDKDGVILFSHCVGCMAGLSECCSHVASVLFYLEAWTKLNGKLACTQVKCTWILPSYVKEVKYAQVKDINFTSAKKLKKNLDSSIEGIPKARTSASCDVKLASPTAGSSEFDSKRITRKRPHIQQPTKSELDRFYETLNKSKIKPVALCLKQPYADSFIMKSRGIQTITDLFKASYLQLSYPALLKVCMETEISISDEEVKCIERDTVEQAKGKGFFRHRAGRIGASMSKSASSSDPALPSQSLIKSICYPDIFTFTNAAVSYGCQHEGDAITAFQRAMEASHQNFEIQKCGLFINKEYPWLHATPDFLVSCSCCGSGCGEVKCPYTIEACDFESYASKPSSCLRKMPDGYKLKRDHAYYYQVQQQLFTTNRRYCDFIVCSFDKGVASFVVERIGLDVTHKDMVIPKLTTFWKICILPEILGRWYTKRANLLLDVTMSNQSALCYCRTNKDEQIATCSNKECPIKSFHFSCLQLSSVGKIWYCPHCRKLPTCKAKSKRAIDKEGWLEEAMARKEICICHRSAAAAAQILQCQNRNCENGKFFHLECLKYKRLPRNYKTTWTCFMCKEAAKSKQVDKPSTINNDKESVATQNSNYTEEDISSGDLDVEQTIGCSERQSDLYDISDNNM